MHDYIVIRDGDGPTAPQLRKLSGKRPDDGSASPVIMSTGNTVYLYIKTDLGDSRKGFRIKYYTGKSDGTRDVDLRSGGDHRL